MEPTFIRSPPGGGASPALTAEALVGTIVDGRYRIVAHIASGGMGAVFRAEHVYMHSPLALKILRAELADSPDIAERFRREAQISASLDHPNIVRVNDFGRTPEGMLFLAMELLEGESLRARIDRERPLKLDDALPILIEIASALALAHARGIVHRDLKPENVFLQRRGSAGTTVKVLDFGIAKLLDGPGAALTQAGLVLGTPRYIAPEQATGSAIDARSDVYALGLLAWRMLSGRHPFDGKDTKALLLAQVSETIPPIRLEHAALAGVIDRACRKNPSERFADGRALLDALEACSTRAQEHAPRVAQTKARISVRLMLPVIALLLLAGLWIIRYQRPVARAERSIAEGHLDVAKAILEREIASDPKDAQLHLLLGRALHRIPGEAGRGIEAYGEAAEILGGKLVDETAFEDLVRDLGRAAIIAEAASRLLVRLQSESLPIVLRAAKSGASYERLRALTLLGDLHAADKLDRAEAFGELLGDEDCDVKRAAAKQLGEIGDPSALPKLADLAKARRHERVLGLFDQTIAACGAPEASAAIKKIRAVQGRAP
jgi:serine/threonine-protein kinase